MPRKTEPCPICESTDTAACRAPEDGGSVQCRNLECLAKFLPAPDAP